MDYDTYEPYEDDLTELGNREAWEDAQADMESYHQYEDEYPELSDDLGDDFNEGWERDEW